MFDNAELILWERENITNNPEQIAINLNLPYEEVEYICDLQNDYEYEHFCF